MNEIIAENAKFFEKMTACFGDLARFAEKIEQIADVAGIDLSLYPIDHLALRTNAAQTAEHWKQILLEGASLLKESEINGRPIGLFSLHQPITFLGQSVKMIELPFPKDKIYPQQGWEHAEAVIPMQSGESVDEWIARLLQRPFKLAENDGLLLKISRPKAKGEALANPTIAIRLNNVTFCNDCCLKLHPYDINDIVMSER